MTKNYLLFTLLMLTCFISSCDLLGDGDGDGDGNGNNGNPIGAETLDCTITDDITLTNRNENGVDYIVDCEMDLRARMDIEEGTIIEFREGAGIEVRQGGSIKANGIGGSPVIFRGQDSGNASWRGIYIFTENTVSVFDFVEIYDAGEGKAYGVFEDDNAAITFDGRIRFTNSKIDNTNGHGIYDKSELYDTEISEFSNNIITGCKDFPLFIDSDYLNEMNLSNSVFEENGRNIIAFTKRGCRLEKKITLGELDIPYYFSDDVAVVDGLEVEAGVQIRMAEGAGLSVETSGPAIVMSGTATNRITIGGDEDQAGYWPGILLRNDANNVFENVDISDGGSAPAGFNDGKANITLEFGGQLTIINCTSSQSNSNCDIILSDFGGVPTLIDMSTGMSVCEE